MHLHFLFGLFPLCRYRLRLHRDCVPAEHLLHRHPRLGSLLPVPGALGGSSSPTGTFLEQCGSLRLVRFSSEGIFMLQKHNVASG